MARFFNTSNNSYLEITKAVSTSFPLTFVSWFACMSGLTTRSLVSISNNDGSDDRTWSLELNGASTPFVRATQTSSVAQTANTVKANVPIWHHAAAVFIGNSSRIASLDGIAVASTTAAVAQFGLARTNIGALYAVSTSVSQQWAGYIHDAAIWQAALSQSEIIDLFLCRKRPGDIRPGSLLMWCPLERDLTDLAKGNLVINHGTRPSANYPPGLGPKMGFPRRGNSKAQPHENVSLLLKPNTARTKTRVLSRIV